MKNNLSAFLMLGAIFFAPLSFAKSNQRSYVSVEKLALSYAEVNPVLFSPNGDGTLDLTFIRLGFEVRGNDGASGKGKATAILAGEVFIRGESGDLLTHAFRREILQAEKGKDWALVELELPWDGTDGEGEWLPEGDYFISYVANKVLVTPSGQENVKDRVEGELGHVRVDISPPEISLLCPSHGAITSGEATAVVGDIRDASEIISVDVNGVAAVVVGNTFYVPAIELLVGSNPIMVTAVDLAGNRITTSSVTVERVTGGGEAMITTWAGDGTTSTLDGDGGPALETSLYKPVGLNLDSDGVLFIADSLHRSVRKVASDGMIYTVAGTGLGGTGGDGGPATAAQFLSAQDVAMGPDHTIYILDFAARKIRKVDAQGMISTVAGNGGFGNSGDGGLATEATFRLPLGIAVDSFGNLYVADAAAGRVRVVDRQGIIHHFAGGPQMGDGILASSARLRLPVDVSETPTGEILIADRSDHRIRRVDRSGLIFTVAGTGSAGFRGDGGPARLARLRSPDHAVMDPEGNIFIADTGNQRVRQVNPSGVIETIAGNGLKGFGGDEGPPEEARLNTPSRLALDALGTLYISDTGNNRVRRIMKGSENPGEPLACIP